MSESTQGSTSQKLNIIPADLLTDRLDRMEEKIDKLSDAMITLARTEQKLVSIEAERSVMNDRMNRHGEKLTNLQNSITDLNLKLAQNEKFASGIQKFFWLIMTAGITAAATFFIGTKS